MTTHTNPNPPPYQTFTTYAGTPPLAASPWVYICSPYASDPEGNTARARGYCALALAAGRIPIAPHLYWPLFLDDTDPNQRAVGLALALEDLARCREVWSFVPTTGPSTGMRGELAQARMRRMPVSWFDIEGAEIAPLPEFA